MKNFTLIKGFLFLLFIIAIFWYVSAYSRSVVPERTFSVFGEGKAAAVPDIAQISIGVLTEGGKNLAELQKENSDKINRVIVFLKGEGIDKKDIKTEYYNISPRYQYFSCPPVPFGAEVVRSCPPSEIIGYSISQSVLVKVRNLDKVGNVIAGVVDNGANTVSGPNFTIDDPIALENQAREEAIKQAREKAKAMARAGGFRLGKLISIQEGFISPFPVYSRVEVKDSGSAPTVEPGSQEIQVNITLVYEIR